MHFTLAISLILAGAASIVAADDDLPTGWRVLDECAIDSASRVLKSPKQTRSTSNTPASCIASCDAQGYSYAGVEYGVECWCGRAVDKNLESAPVSSCNMPCSGDSTQNCGAGWRISLYTTEASTTPTSTLPSGWSTAADCALDNAARLFTDIQVNYLTDNTPNNCASLCASEGFGFAAVEYGRECYCGSNLANSITPRPVSDCYMECSGDSTQECGGPWAAQLYSNPSLISSGTTTLTTATSTSSASASTFPAGWSVLHACAVDSAARILTNTNYLTDNTPSVCAAFCNSKGFTMSGTEYGRECYCGSSYNFPAVDRPASECNMPCSGDSLDTCGAGWRIQIVGAPEASATATTTTAAPTATFPAGWSVLHACAVDSAARVLTQVNYLDGTNTPLTCAALCDSRGFTMSGTEYGRECYCGSSYNIEPVDRPASECNMLCAGDNGDTCGAGWRIQIVGAPVTSSSSTSSTTSTATTTTSSATPTPTVDPSAMPAGWTMAYACAEDNASHILPDFNTLSDNTPARCAQLCDAKGFSISGVEYGGECSCGDAFAWTPVLRPTSECDKVCTGDAALMCGAGWRTQLYTKNAALVPATTEITELPTTGSSTDSATATSTETSTSTGTSTSTEASTSTSTSASSSTSTSTSASTSTSTSTTSSATSTSTTTSTSTATSATTSTSTSASTSSSTSTSTSTSTTTTTSTSTTPTSTSTTTTTTTTTSSGSTSTQPASAYGQCGGVNWSGPTTCTSGYYCRFSDQYYSQCVPGTAATTTTTTSGSSSTGSSGSCTNPITQWSQCGGQNWGGSTCCVDGYYCQWISEYLSQCIPNQSSSAYYSRYGTAPASTSTSTSATTSSSTSTSTTTATTSTTTSTTTTTTSSTTSRSTTATTTTTASGSSSTGTCTNPITQWSQCGGQNWGGSTCCVDGFYCQWISEYLSQCIPNQSSSAYYSRYGTAPASTSTTTTTTAAGSTATCTSASSAVAHYGQCGGQGWTGGKVCACPYTCVKSNDYYSQCL